MIPYPRLESGAMTENTPANPESPAPPPPDRPPPKAHNIVLVGFMATGKSTLGKMLARRCDFSFIDCDREIVRAAGKPIPQIFAQDGEAAFRAHETEVLRQLAATERAVIATGGGVVTRPENHPLLRDLGFVVWLHTKKSVIFERVQRNPHRPLLKTADPYATISALVEERKPLYRAVADLKIKTTTLTPREAVGGILESASWFFAHYFPKAPHEDDPK